MASARFVLSGIHLTTKAGKPLTFGKINFFATGGVVDQDTFPTTALSGANANPLILDADGLVPEAWAADTKEFSIVIKDENDNVILPTVNNIFFLTVQSVTPTNVLAALAANSAAMVLNGSEMSGSAFAAFADALTLTAAGALNTRTGNVNLGIVTGITTLTSTVLNTGVSGTAVQDDDAFASPSATKVASSESIKALVDAQIAGSDFTLDSTTPRTAAFTALIGKFYLIDTTSASFDITMPLSPTAGDAVAFQDYAGTFAANPMVLLQNPTSDENIFRSDANGQISINNFSGALGLTDTTNGWMSRGF